MLNKWKIEYFQNLDWYFMRFSAPAKFQTLIWYLVTIHQFDKIFN